MLLVPRGRFRIRKWHLGRFPRSKVRPCWYGEALHLSVAPLRPGEARRNSFPLHTLKGPTSSKKPIFNPGSTCAGRFRLDDALKASAHVVSFIESSTIAHVPISALQSSTTIAVVVTHALVKYTFSQLTFSKS